MKNNMYWDLIIRYLEGDYTTEDEKKIKEWLEANANNKQELDRLIRIWDVPPEDLPKPDVEKALMQVAKKAGIKELLNEPSSQKVYKLKPEKPEISFLTRLFGVKLIKAAAVLAVILLIPYLAVQFFKSDSYENFISDLSSIEIEKGTYQEFTLNDGTKVTLDAGTVFKYPEDFDSNKREVFIDGEGYFQVQSNPEKPFLIHAGDAVVTVLGTKFNVRAWSDNQRVEVAVIEGRVSLQAENNTDKEAEVIITKGYLSILRKGENPTEPEAADIENCLSWMNHEMSFNSVPFREVLEQLERWYDLEFVLPNESYEINKVTIYIERKPIEDILDMVCLIMDFNFKREENKIIFSVNN